MKKKNPVKKSLKRQLISGTVYIALAAVVVAVTVNTTAGIFSGGDDIPPIDMPTEDLNVELPSVPELPQLSVPELSLTNPATPESQPVSDSAEGIDASVTENLSTGSESDTAPENASVTEPTVDAYGIPVDANLGLDRFIKPCAGFITVSHSVELPVYSPTMSDYRTHIGVDVAESLGTEIVAVCGGIVTDIYTDDLYGMTVEVVNREGYTVRYSNLTEKLSAGIEKGAILKTGASIGGIGETAICEAVETPHVHLEIYDAKGTPVNPEDLIDF